MEAFPEKNTAFPLDMATQKGPNRLAYFGPNGSAVKRTETGVYPLPIRMLRDPPHLAERISAVLFPLAVGRKPVVRLQALFRQVE